MDHAGMAFSVVKIAPLQNEIEAGLLRDELTERDIPHCIISYHDSAFDGLFQLVRGWGHVEAALEHKETVMLALEAIRQPHSESGSGN